MLFFKSSKWHNRKLNPPPRFSGPYSSHCTTQPEGYKACNHFNCSKWYFIITINKQKFYQQADHIYFVTIFLTYYIPSIKVRVELEPHSRRGFDRPEKTIQRNCSTIRSSFIYFRIWKSSQSNWRKTNTFHLSISKHLDQGWAINLGRLPLWEGHV